MHDLEHHTSHKERIGRDISLIAGSSTKAEQRLAATNQKLAEAAQHRVQWTIECQEQVVQENQARLEVERKLSEAE